MNTALSLLPSCLSTTTINNQICKHQTTIMLPAAFAWAIICATATAIIGLYTPSPSDIILLPIVGLSCKLSLPLAEHLFYFRLTIPSAVPWLSSYIGLLVSPRWLSPTKTVNIATANYEPTPEPQPLPVSIQSLLHYAQPSQVGMCSPFRLDISHRILIMVLVLVRMLAFVYL
jgi:hypothetical protein